MRSPRKLYWLLSLPGQPIASQLAAHGLSDCCVDLFALARMAGMSQIALDNNDKLTQVATAQGRAVAASLLRQRLENGDPTLLLGAADAAGMALIDHLDKALGYRIQPVDFIAPLLAKQQNHLQWQALQAAVKTAPAGRSLEDWLTSQIQALQAVPDQGLEPKLRKDIAQALAKDRNHWTFSATALTDQIEATLTWYADAPWTTHGWQVASPADFFASVEAKLAFEKLPRQAKKARKMLFIGDVCGDAEDLAEILAQFPDADISLLGDYFQGGPQAAAVLKLLASQQHRVHLLRGDRDVALMQALVHQPRQATASEQAVLDQFVEADIPADLVRDFFAGLADYRAVENFNAYFLCHAGIEPALLSSWQARDPHWARMVLAPSRVFTNGIAPVDDTPFSRDVDDAWISERDNDVIGVHSHRNDFDYTVLADARNRANAVNLADLDETHLRYLEVDREAYIMHIRRRFSPDETLIRGTFA